jgi:hypothetical protein
MGLAGWGLTFALLIIVVLISAAIMKWVQSAATSVPKSRRKDEEDNG